ncbi:MAG: MFS transporter [Candidatus Eremiobacterota bacterium]
MSLPRIFLLCLTGFVLNFTIHFGIILTYSLFLKQLGPGYMPYHYMSFILSAFIGIILFLREVSGIKWLNILTLTMGFIYVTLPVTFTWHEVAVTFIIFIITRLYFIYGIIFFFSFINTILTVREGKKYIGILSGTGFMGAIIAGYITKPLLVRYSMDYCFILTGFMCILNLLPIFILKATGIKEIIKEKRTSLAFTQILNINFVRLMIVFVVLSGIIRYFIDFEFSAVLSSNFKDSKELAIFYGNFNAVSNITILIAQILFTGKILENLSLSTSFKIISGIFIVFSMLCSVNPQFWFIVSFQFIFMVITRIMIEPCRRILVGAVSSDIRSGVRFVTEGIFYATGVALTGVFIVFLNLFFQSPFIFFFIVFILSIMYYYWGGKLDRAYIDALIGNLKRKEIASSDGDIENLKKLSLPGTEEGKRRILEALDKEKDPSFLSAILKLAGNLKKDKKLYDRIVTILENTDDTRVIVSAIEVLARWGDEESVKTIVPFMSHNMPEVKGTAILAVMKMSAKPEELQEGTFKIILMLKDGNGENRSIGLEIMGELGLTCFIPAIARFFNDSDMNVRKRAVNVALKLRASSLLNELSLMLEHEEHEENRDIIKRAIERITDDTFEEITLLVKGLNVEDKQKVITSVRKIKDRSVLELSLRALSLDEKTISVKLVEIIERYKDDVKSLDLLKHSFIEKSFSTEVLIEDIMKTGDIKGVSYNILQAVAGNGINEFIAGKVSEFIDNSQDYDREFIKVCFYMAGICSLGIDTALGAYENIISGESHKRDLAVEVIETAVDHRNLKKSLLKLITQ